MEGEISLLVDPEGKDGAEPVWRRAIEILRAARESIEIHMFVWRSDAIGNRMAGEVLQAADRGVKVRIRKDAGALMYERIEMNGKPLLRRPLPWTTRLSHRISALGFPDSRAEDGYGFELGERLARHPNVALEWVRGTHTKYYLADGERLLLGSVNLEDRHRGYRDYMAEIAGPGLVARFLARRDGTAPPDPARDVDFLVNARGGAGRRFEIKPAILDLLAGARRSVHLEMAYLGDPDVDDALAAAARRGIAVSILLSRTANVGNDLNYRTLHRLCRRARIAATFSERMIHSKMMLVDGETALLGSANLSVFSLRKAEEIDVLVRRHPAFLSELRREAERRMSEGIPMRSIDELSRYRPLVAALQQAHQFLH